jgi:ribosomal 50S subunit-recycling heat shock protein
MKGMLTTAALAIAATLAVAAPASTEILPGTDPTREAYTAEIEPICKKNTESNKPVLKDARESVKRKDLKGAGADFIKVSKNFGRALKSIESVPRPSADNLRLEKWFKFLRIVKTNLAQIGKALKQENRVKANHEKIRTERSSNAANNVSFVFGFRDCRLAPSQFK